MSVLLILVQLLLLPPMVALAILAYRTPRRQRHRHSGFMGLAFLLALGATMGALGSLALALGGDETVDPLLSFAPPLLTLAAGAMVARRGLARRARADRSG